MHGINMKFMYFSTIFFSPQFPTTTMQFFFRCQNYSSCSTSPPMPVVLGLIFLYFESCTSLSVTLHVWVELWSVKKLLSTMMMMLLLLLRSKKTQYLGGWEKHFRFNFHFCRLSEIVENRLFDYFGLSKRREKR